MMKRKQRRAASTALVALAFTAVTNCFPTIAASAPSRVVSINLCTDQLALALADPGQIAALNRWAHDPQMSFLAAHAAGLREIRGSAEEVLRLHPDLVLAGTFSATATVAMLRQQRIDVETFSPPATIEAAKAEIERSAALLGRPERGAALVAEIDAALGRAKPSTGRRPTALALQRRGYVSAGETLIADVMRRVGLDNAADALGLHWVQHVSLEVVARTRPDLLVLESGGDGASDQASALLRHPVLAGLPSRHVVVPFTEQDCAGPALPALIRRLAEAVNASDERF